MHGAAACLLMAVAETLLQQLKARTGAFATLQRHDVDAATYSRGAEGGRVQSIDANVVAAAQKHVAVCAKGVAAEKWGHVL